MTVWEAIEKLNTFIDGSDPDTSDHCYCAPSRPPKGPYPDTPRHVSRRRDQPPMPTRYRNMESSASVRPKTLHSVLCLFKPSYDIDMPTFNTRVNVSSAVKS
jgi:hypothetical protein